MDAIQILQELISILVGGITGIAQGIGEGLQQAVTSIMFVVSEGTITGLSTFGIVIIIFAAISLGFSLTRLVYQLITSLGNKNN